MPRYVILRHLPSASSSRPLHWDLMLECGELLATWALQQEPLAEVEIAAEKIADHRRAYLDYEGPISGGRGEVSQWDAGAFDLLGSSELCWKVKLRGRRIDGQATLQRETGEDQRWRVVFSGSVSEEA